MVDILKIVGDNKPIIHCGDSFNVMRTLPENFVDTVISDPPYGLSFMGKDWDYGIPGEKYWREALRVAKPGALLFAFGGTRTFHRLVCAIEDAGWEIRDTIMWVYSSGFPKSHNISKGMDKHLGAEREKKRITGTGNILHFTSQNDRPWKQKALEKGYHELAGDDPVTDEAKTWDGWGTALKPAWEPIVVAMKPLDKTFVNNALVWGVSGFHIDGGRVPAEDEEIKTSGRSDDLHAKSHSLGGSWSGVVDESVRNSRWPANLIHDGSDDVVKLFPTTKPSKRTEGSDGRKNKAFYSAGDSLSGGASGERNSQNSYNDSGSAARFFYCAKASRKEKEQGLEALDNKEIGRGTSRKCANCGLSIVGRNQNGKCTCSNRVEQHTSSKNPHPTVKPLALMEYLCRLSETPTGGIVLDPFMGSGSTGVAAINTGRSFIGIDITKEYCTIAAYRMGADESVIIDHGEQTTT